MSCQLYLIQLLLWIRSQLWKFKKQTWREGSEDEEGRGRKGVSSTVTFFTSTADTPRLDVVLLKLVYCLCNTALAYVVFHVTLLKHYLSVSF
ncbi:Uncharacterized protein TCM_025751 [Theobroma cacao]|uniref:Uncharacterized protein n=1 Tax=Theobroma cacao TaxID=3641 RepID=A0A061F118_THECC|nr:Uncharacterized protein TCM_025751 [Theobroma cacao]